MAPATADRLIAFARRARAETPEIGSLECASWPEEARASAALVWSRRGIAEAQSVALAERIREHIARVSGSDRDALIEACDRLLEDERRHVALARAFLERLGGRAPRSPPGIAPDRAEPWQRFLLRCVLTGLAVCETVSAMRFATVREHTDLAVPRACIESFLRDEIAHARLGFLLLPTVLEERAAGIGRDAMMEEVRIELRSTFRHLDLEVGMDAERRGIVLVRRPQPPMNPGVVEPALDALALRRAIRRAVIPRLARLGIDAAPMWTARWA